MNHEQTDKWGMLVVKALYAMAFAVLIPWGDNYERVFLPVDHIKPELAISHSEARAIQDQVSEEMRRHRAGRYSGEDAYRHKFLLIKIDRYYRDKTVPIFASNRLRDHNTSLLRANEETLYRQKDRKYAQEQHDVFRRKLDSDPEYLAMANFRDMTFDFQLEAYTQYAKSRYPFAMAIAMLGIFGLMRIRGVAFTWSMLPLTMLATASFAVSWPFFPYRDPRQQAARVLNIASMAFSLLMGFSGAASAQTVKKDGADGKQKRRGTNTLQLDARIAAPMVDDPAETGTIRLSWYGSRAMAETIATATPETNAWYNETAAGPKIGPNTFAVAVLTNGSNRPTGWGIGVEHFQRIKKRIFVGIPVLRYEGGGTFWAAGLSQVQLGKSRWSIGPEASYRKTKDRPANWYGAVVVRFQIKRGVAESCTQVNNLGVATQRFRLIQNFPF